MIQGCCKKLVLQHPHFCPKGGQLGIVVASNHWQRLFIVISTLALYANVFYL